MSNNLGNVFDEVNTLLSAIKETTNDVAFGYNKMLDKVSLFKEKATLIVPPFTWY